MVAVECVEFCGMIGCSPAMQRLFSLVRRLAPHVRTMLVSGETGVGKELVARAVHDCGDRRHRQFVAVSCSAVTEPLLESELFGHVRGAFTGAIDDRAGLFEFADGGTLFLDEIAELPLAAQAKLLRALETGEVRRLGAVQARPTDICVIAATSRELWAEVAAGRFRDDLYYRLTAVPVIVPPLRERREDIPHLAAAFVCQAGARLGKRLTGVTRPAEQRLMDAPWGGNVRELRNVIERACILADGEYITERELSGLMTRSIRSLYTALPPSDHRPWPAAAGPSLSAMERGRILEVLQQTGGNKMRAARILGVSRRSLYRRLERYRITNNDLVAPSGGRDMESTT